MEIVITEHALRTVQNEFNYLKEFASERLLLTEYEKLLEEVDELDAIKAYDKAKGIPPAEGVFKSIERKRKR